MQNLALIKKKNKTADTRSLAWQMYLWDT